MNTIPHITCRQATEKDAALLAQIHVEAWKHSYRNYVPQEVLNDRKVTKERLEKMKSDIRQGLVFVVSADNRPAGFLALAPGLGEEAEIAVFYIAPAYQRQGLGGKLLHFVLEKLKHNGCKKVFLWTMKDFPASNSFYRKAGGKATGEEQEWKYGLKVMKFEFFL